MKIHSILVYLVKIPYRPLGSRWIGREAPSFLESTVVEVATDTGLSGFGESCPIGGFYLPAFAGGVRAGIGQIAPRLIGKDPTAIARINHAMDQALYGHPHAKAPVDIACWDLLGQSCDLSVSEAMGGRLADSVPAYISIPLTDPEAMVAAWQQKMQEGFRHFQVKVGGDPVEDVARIHALASRDRDGCIFMADANRGWKKADALHVVSSLDGIRCYIEQPCATYAESLTVRGKCRQPFILDEVIDGPQDLARAIGDDALDALVIKITHAGGLSQARVLRDLCVAHGIRMRIEDTAGSEITPRRPGAAGREHPRRVAARVLSFPERTPAHRAGCARGAPGQAASQRPARSRHHARPGAARGAGRGVRKRRRAMLITAISLYRVELPFHRAYRLSGGRTWDRLDSTVIRVDTDAGITGWGEACPFGPNYLEGFAEGARAGIGELAPALLGADPSGVLEICRRMDRDLLGHPYVKSGIDIACWDILGKRAQRPLHDLFGGRINENVRASGWIPPEPGPALDLAMAANRENGCTQFSTKASGRPEADIAFLRHLEERLETGESVKFDANGGWRVDEAIRVMRATAALDVYFEQPCRSYEECRSVFNACGRPLVLDECALDLETVVRAWNDGVLCALNLKIDRVGGLTPALAIRNSCDALGIPYHIQCAGGKDIMQAAILHLAHSAPCGPAAPCLGHRRSREPAHGPWARRPQGQPDVRRAGRRSRRGAGSGSARPRPAVLGGSAGIVSRRPCRPGPPAAVQPTASIIARAQVSVSAVPPRSLVRAAASVSADSMASSRTFAAGSSPRCSSIIAAVQTAATGLAMP